MRNTVLLLGSVVVLALVSAGCRSQEQKLGRGVENTMEITRMGELQRSMEQNGLFYGPEAGMTTGIIEGMNHTVARTGLGIYEVVTFPFPPYHPILTNYLSARPGYPDAYRPHKWMEAVYDTDHSLGFSGGDVAPWFPGSRFRVFDN